MPRRPYHMSSNMRPRAAKQQINNRFSKKYTSLNLPGLHNSLPFRGADCRLSIQFQKVTPKQAIYLHG